MSEPRTNGGLRSTLALAHARPVQAEDFPVIKGLEKQRSVWMSTCMGCHGDGLADAPPILDRQAWAPRLAKGRGSTRLHDGRRRVTTLNNFSTCSRSAT